MIEDNDVSEEKIKLRQDMDGKVKLLLSAPAVCFGHSAGSLLCVSSDTLEMLAKRDKDVLTLSAQVEAFRSQIAGV